MSIVDRYLAYADAFEESFEDDDWSRIEPYFTENAVYEGEPEANDRAAIMTRFKNALDGFDRRMDKRILNFDTPTAEGNTVTVNWTVTFQKAGIPDLVMKGRETAVFEGDQIARLRDDLSPETEESMGLWMAEHGASLA